jgi:L-methionine (R)-S-oxide reductase
VELSEDHPRTTEEETPLETLLASIREAVADSAHRVEAARRAVEHLSEGVDHYSWIGIYWVEGGELALGPWAGPEATEHTRIPVGQGICGAAAASGETEIIDDVDDDDRYISCFPSTRSEIVVPIRAADGTVMGEIDIDSDVPGAFGPDDVELLEATAAELAVIAQQEPVP